MQHSKYRILGLVGQGQFGRVFCASVRETPAKDSRLTSQLVALKELSHQKAPTSEFLRELWFLITLQHPNIVTCRALEHTATGRYLVMDYCEGGTLRNLLKQDRPLRLLEGLQLVMELLAGLDYAHRRGVVHCDIKPENILLTLGSKGWSPRLSDFGIARRLPEIGTTRLHQEISPDATVGSPAYMAPERFYGLYSPMSDIYAVGILLFELLMGYRPFGGAPGDLRWAHLNQRLQLPDAIPEPLQAIVKKSLEKLPARRFASASQMAQALRLIMYDPAVRQLGDCIVPWENPTTNNAKSLKSDTDSALEVEEEKSSQPAINLLRTVRYSVLQPKPLILPAPLTALIATEKYLYASIGKEVKVWCQPGQHAVTTEEMPTSILMPEIVRGILPASHGCCVLTQQKLYWQGDDRSGEPQCLLDMGLRQGADAFKAAIDSQGRWLTVAVPGELRFYALADNSTAGDREKALKPIATVALPEHYLPELTFLDRRHVLAVWPDNEPKNPQTIFRVYTRRGTSVGSVKLSASVGQMLLTPEPYTLLGIPQGGKAAVLSMKLWPLKLARIPLESLPVSACVTKWGWVLADAGGQIAVLNSQGIQVGNFSGPASPRAIAPWGSTGLVIAANTESETHLHFLDVDVEETNPRSNLKG
ncbi:MAG: serine/threonine protein kinase [Microcoleus sp. PH2017_29_MFU_D_A]|uniref:serine/threonine-protein kinase n=1 Tax=unclassified Microcoleus TaxID=2642155 RepID=UPI001D489D3F|nr:MULTISPECIES: serine/threonine-protein kinase [unclassified Microcoleus]MCC3420506.1 serine/threonine protein kinase [Microcoleus sp. PH2017_07_MST_O_A]TAG68767.1 MAG: serine/threonine protein kinase [Oscillatoriales cyanobacterium]MCC3426186.1 serine/threonine protein kinase [Microcoleus sp. PH2017_01_SCD_O_A]MCC3455980.1 serine/threonine protein kinase [Microcoleus sp. PH2017_08_TRC_O_A]MCC3500482.1 serine/threonine protein kinase [Microcoleus sp. PH2017_15_JOR_U_A]